MSVTMKDIAMLVGVSRQAVSAALNSNNSYRISEAKRQEIRRVADELNYIPNSAARSLKGAPTKTIGIMGSAFSSGLNSTLIGEISQMLMLKGYSMLYSDYSFSNFNETDALLQLLARGVDGIIIHNSEENVILEQKQTVPYLFYSHNNLGHVDVGSDNEYGGYLATKHLLEHGHEKVGFIIIQPHQMKDSRYLGWKRAHDEANIEINNNHVISLRELNGDVSATINCIKEKKMTAIFATNDFVAAKLMHVLLQNGIRVPEDVALIGYDGYSFSEFCKVPLTTIIQPVRPQAEIGVKLLLERIQNKELNVPPANHKIKPILYKGASCGCKAEPAKDLYQINTYQMLEKDAKMNFNKTLF